MTTLTLGVGYDLAPHWSLPVRVMLAPRVQTTWPQWSQLGLELGAGLRVEMSW
jgi:hypothetical protein